MELREARVLSEGETERLVSRSDKTIAFDELVNVADFMRTAHPAAVAAAGSAIAVAGRPWLADYVLPFALIIA